MKRLIFVLLVIGFAILKAQEQNFELKKINFQGNKTLSARELHSILVSKESPSKFWQILYKVNKRLGDKPQYLEKIKVANDIISLRNYYLDNGFFDVKIDTLIYYNYESKEAILNFLVDEGRPYLIDKIDFTGLEQIPDSLRRICMNFSFLKVGKRYRRVDVEAEIQRILNLLYDNGYQNAYVERVGIRVLVDSTKKIVSVFVPFNPNERYLIKDIKILVEGTGKMKVSEELVRREIEFKEGEFYSRSLILKSEANLSQTGLFENVRINLEPTGKADTVHLADVNVWVVPRNKHDIFPSIYFSDERNAFNVGVSVDYQNRNFLGGGEKFFIECKVSDPKFKF
ncbi:Surface antigen variable number repeat-containing protein [Candidatus Kryptonium thompsonii]|nr:Surface antigen variable number repeat-containing protein [Candidatus Kryptonium thompsoni]